MRLEAPVVPLPGLAPGRPCDHWLLKPACLHSTREACAASRSLHEGRRAQQPSFARPGLNRRPSVCETDALPTELRASGAGGNRTRDLLHAMQTLYRLSYDPVLPGWCVPAGIECRSATPPPLRPPTCKPAGDPNADGAGFEPTLPFESPTFQAGAFDHSANHPDMRHTGASGRRRARSPALSPGPHGFRNRPGAVPRITFHVLHHHVTWWCCVPSAGIEPATFCSGGRCSIH